MAEIDTKLLDGEYAALVAAVIRLTLDSVQVTVGNKVAATMIVVLAAVEVGGLEAVVAVIVPGVKVGHTTFTLN